MAGKCHQHGLCLVGVYEKSEAAGHGQNAGDGKFVRGGLLAVPFSPGAVDQKERQCNPESAGQANRIVQWQ